MMPGKHTENPALEALAEVVADGACRLHLWTLESGSEA